MCSDFAPTPHRSGMCVDVPIHNVDQVTQAVSNIGISTGVVTRPRTCLVMALGKMLYDYSRTTFRVGTLCLKTCQLCRFGNNPLKGLGLIPHEAHVVSLRKNCSHSRCCLNKVIGLFQRFEDEGWPDI